jgi:D-glycero-D-manno-heptose 1,7-bisphosphate phosphatase
MTLKTIFLDRDGVINKEVKYLFRIIDFDFIEGVFDACLYFHNLGYKIIIISNQSGIARGYYNDNDYQKLTKWMLNEFSKKGVSVLDILYCPHRPESQCNCRKPKPGMLNEAKYKHSIEMDDSWMIGDKETDIEAARLAGVNNTILVRSGHMIEEHGSNAMYIVDSIKESINIIT